jgi:hypothetical protein
LVTTLEELSAFELRVFVASRKFKAAMLLYMSESFRGARKLKGLVIGVGPESFDRAIARVLIDHCQGVGVLVFFSPVVIRSSRQFIEMLRNGLFEFGRDADDSRDLAGKKCEAEML